MNKSQFTRVHDPKVGQVYRLKVKQCGEAIVKLVRKSSMHYVAEIIEGGFKRCGVGFYKGQEFYVSLSSSFDWYEAKE